MRTIHKKIVMDEKSRPVAVQIDYEDWLEIEQLLETLEAKKSEAERSRFQARLYPFE